MTRITFSCLGCRATLGVAPADVGKTVACPKCQHRSLVPAFEVVESEPPPPARATAPPPPPEPEPEPEKLPINVSVFGVRA